MAARLPLSFAAAAAAATASAAASTTGSGATSKAATTKVVAARASNHEEQYARRAIHSRARCGSPTRPPVGLAGTPGRRSWAPGLLGAVYMGRVAHAEAADVAMAESTSEAALAPLEDGEKPEFIQRADEQAESMKPRLRRPSLFHEQFNEVSQLTAVHAFEGFRLDAAKAVTPTFFTHHSIFFGNPQFPQGHYQGNLTVVGEGDTSVRASMDADCSASMDANFSLGMPGLIGKLSVHQGKNDLIQGTALYMGETWAGQVSGGSGPVDISYNQAVTERLSIGGQGQFSAAQQAVGLLYGFKYNTPEWSVLGRYIGGGANVVTAQYLRRVVPGRVALGAEYQAQIGAGSQMTLGGEFSLRQSKMSASVDCNGKVDSALEVRVGTFPTLPVTLTISSSLDHAEDKHSFGVALSCGQ